MKYTGTASPPAMVWLRRPWLAGVLGFFPGLGQVYAGRLARGIAGAAAVYGAGILALLVMMHLSRGPVTLALPLIVMLAVWAAVIADGVRIARRTSDGFAPRWYNRWYVYVLFALALHLPLDVVRGVHAETFRITAGGMAPALLPGDMLFASRSAYGIRLPGGERRVFERSPARGDLVIFELPDVSEASLVMRAVGLPGDTLLMLDGRLLVNGRPEEAAYELRLDGPADHPTRDNWGPLVVPDEHYFVLGDNRRDTVDSRDWGPVPASALRGSPVRIYFSRDAEARAVRWDRVGRRVD